MAIKKFCNEKAVDLVHSSGTCSTVLYEYIHKVLVEFWMNLQRSNIFERHIYKMITPITCLT